MWCGIVGVFRILNKNDFVNFLSICLSISTYLSIYLFIYLSIYLFICLSIYYFIFLSEVFLYLSIYINESILFRFSPALIPAEQQTGSYYNLYTDSKHVVEVGNVKPVFVTCLCGVILKYRLKVFKCGIKQLSIYYLVYRLTNSYLISHDVIYRNLSRVGK